MTKQILLVAVLLLSALGASAQNKVFNKYSDMKGVDCVSINESMLDIGAAVLGEMIEDENSPVVTKLQKMVVVVTSDKAARKKLNSDIKSLAKKGGYEDIMSGSSDGARYAFLFNEKSSPRELVIYANDGKKATAIVALGSFNKKEVVESLESMDE